jgi:hypothetical protein
LHILTHHEMRGVRVERLNGYSNETGCVVFIHCQWYSMPCPFIPNAATTTC